MEKISGAPLASFTEWAWERAPPARRRAQCARSLPPRRGEAAGRSRGGGDKAEAAGESGRRRRVRENGGCEIGRRGSAGREDERRGL